VKILTMPEYMSIVGFSLLPFYADQFLPQNMLVFMPNFWLKISLHQNNITPFKLFSYFFYKKINIFKEFVKN